MSVTFAVLSSLVLLHLTNAFPANKGFGSSPTVDCNAARAAALEHTVHNKLRPNDWIPECEKDGSFKILQKNVSGMPFCSTSKGILAYQPDAPDPSVNLECECPLRFYERVTSMNRYRGVYIPFCTPEGQYKSVQCLPGNPRTAKDAPVEGRLARCFCADEKGKKLADKPVASDDTYCDNLRRDRKKKQ